MDATANSRGTLATLGEVQLDGVYQELLNQAAVRATGTRPWRARKLAEAWDLLALAQIAPWRMRLEHLDLGEALRAVVRLRTPVPCRPGGSEELALADHAVLGLTYTQEALLRPLPGYAFVQILAPHDIYHAQVLGGPPQPLCLGSRLPAAVRVIELVLMAYGALSMQTVMLDELDPAGVMNGDAARWWQQNTDRFPLTRVPFLANPDEEEGEE